MSDEIAKLRGQRDVLLQLLRDAADVLHTVVCEDADEERELQALRKQIADACGGVMLALFDERQRGQAAAASGPVVNINRPWEEQKA